MDETPPTDRLELEPDLPPGQEPEEGELTTRSIRYTPAQQGLEIPAGWKPTARQPVPVVRCVYVRPENHATAPGERCNKWSLRGSRLCFFHSGRGNLKNVEEYRQAVVESARMMLVDAAPDAIKMMLDLAANSGADNVRLKAVTEILDRAGIRGGQEFDVRVDVTDSLNPAQTLAERLSKLKEAADAVATKQAAHAAAADALALEAGDPVTSPLPAQPGEDIIDAEVVSDTAEPESE